MEMVKPLKPSEASQSPFSTSMRMFFLRAKSVWPTWGQHLDEKTIALAVHEWSKALHGITPDMIDRATDICIVTSKYPPSIAEFLTVCESLGDLPDAKKIANDAIRRDFTHPLTKKVFDRVGINAFKNDGHKELMEKVISARDEIIREERIARITRGIENCIVSDE